MVARSLRARRSVSKPEMPGMRTSEIIMLMSSLRSSSNACSPELASIVSKPWPLKKESSRLRWLASSSTMRMRGALRGIFAASAAMSSALRYELQVSKAEDRALRLVGQAFDVPPVSEHNLLHDRQAQAGPFFMRGDIRLENFQALTGRHSVAIVANFEGGFRSVCPAANDLDFAAWIHRLSRIQQKVEQRLPKQLLVGLNDQLIAGDVELNIFLLNVVIQRPHYLADHSAKTDCRATHFARARKVDEFVQLGRDPVGFIDNFRRFCPNLRRSFLLFGDHLREAPDDI